VSDLPGIQLPITILPPALGYTHHFFATSNGFGANMAPKNGYHKIENFYQPGLPVLLHHLPGKHNLSSLLFYPYVTRFNEVPCNVHTQHPGSKFCFRDRGGTIAAAKVKNIHVFGNAQFGYQ
jgi:hypothetical protein